MESVYIRSADVLNPEDLVATHRRQGRNEVLSNRARVSLKTDAGFCASSGADLNDEGVHGVVGG